MLTIQLIRVLLSGRTLIHASRGIATGLREALPYVSEDSWLQHITEQD